MPKKRQIREDPNNGSVAKWFAKQHGALGLKSAVVTITKDLLAKTNQTRPPVDLKPIASLRAVYRTVYTARNEGCARLQSTPEGFVILLQKHWHWIIRRDWWAHEIAHTFFYDIESLPPKRLIETSGKDEEFICDMLARELLIPYSFLTSSDVMLGAPSIFELRRLSKLFKTTVSTMSHRLICDLMLWDAIVFFCEYREHLFPKSKQVENPESALRIVNRIAPRKPGYFAPLNKRVGNIAIIRNALIERRFIKDLVSFEDFGDLSGEKEVEAIPIISGSNGQPGVMVIIKAKETLNLLSEMENQKRKEPCLPF